MARHTGGCHCGKVRFELNAPAELEVFECDCSICKKLGNLALLVEEAQFRLLKGRDDLITYTFHTKQAQHYFCSTCGVESFYVPRERPNRMGVNARCLDEDGATKITVTPFDGANWE